MRAKQIKLLIFAIALSALSMACAPIKPISQKSTTSIEANPPKIISAKIWATAISKKQSTDRAIVFRYIKEFNSGFERSEQPDRIILVWKYKSDRGMPMPEELGQMVELEDALEPYLQDDNFASLALVSTGEDRREWVYYAKSADEFIQRLNKALAGNPPFPIEIYTAHDPNWNTYQNFSADVQN